MRRVFLPVTLFLFQAAVFGQDYHAIESVKKEIQEQKQDTNTVNHYLTLGGAYVWSFPDSSIQYLQKALLLSNRLHFRNGLFASLGSLAFPLSLVREDSAAVSSALKCIEMAEEAKSSDELASAYYTLGSVYMYIEDFKKALFYHRKALTYMHADDLGTISTAHEHLAQCFLGLNQTDSAFYYAKKVLQYNEQHKIERGFDLYQLGSIHLQKGKPDSALSYYKQGLAIVTKQRIRKDMADCNLGIANVFERKNAYDSAIHYAKDAWEIASATGLPNEKLGALTKLTSVFALQGKKDSAYTYQKYALALKDTFFNADKVRQVQLLAFNEEMRKQQEAEAERKRLNTNIIIALCGLLLFAFIIVVIIYRHNRQRKKAYALLQKQKEEITVQKVKTEKALEELKATQQQLIQSEKMASLGELTAGIAHEIQNPLNFVNNFSEVNTELIGELKAERFKPKAERNDQLQDELLDDINENEQKINHHGKRADAIVKGMLQHSRTTSRVKEPTDINALADEYLRLSYYGLRAKDNPFNAAMKTDFDKTIGNINIIPQDIGRVLFNLYNNAFYATNEKSNQHIEGYEPTVSVRTKKTGDKVEISVKDNGYGISQKIVDKIFQPFFTTKPSGQGTGLGLSLSYDIIKAHGGEIKVETKEGEGSEFEIQLPV
jgi:signal transduction histidine kinase